MRTARTIEPPIIRGNAKPEFVHIFGTFMPKKPDIIVGIAREIVIIVKDFMTLFRLLEIMEAKAFIMPLRMLE